MIGSVIFNLLITVCTAVSVWLDIKKAGAKYLMRFFTIQSNLLCAFAALLVLIFRLAGPVPNGVLVFKHIGTVAAAVTLLVVLFYLAPAAENYFSLFRGTNLFLHLLCPLFAIVSLILWDRPKGGFGIVLLGLLPVAVYGALYMYKVLKAPEGERWDDFYGFTAGGKWWLSFIAVGLVAFLASLAFRLG